ncbi:unnamed protein product, partial [Owenia fusiformis]
MATLIVGDSQLKYVQKFFDVDEAVVLSYSGCKIEDLLEKVSDILPSFDNIIYHVGTNNSSNETVTQIMRKFQKLVFSTLSKQFCHVYVSGILPRARSHFPKETCSRCQRYGEECRVHPSDEALYNMNTTARMVNLLLRHYCGETPRVTYIPHIDFAKHGKIVRGMLSRDGHHINARGQAVLCHNLFSAVSTVESTIGLTKGYSVKVPSGSDLSSSGSSTAPLRNSVTSRDSATTGAKDSGRTNGVRRSPGLTKGNIVKVPSGSDLSGSGSSTAPLRNSVTSRDSATTGAKDSGRTSGVRRSPGLTKGNIVKVPSGSDLSGSGSSTAPLRNSVTSRDSATTGAKDSGRTSGVRRSPGLTKGNIVKVPSGSDLSGSGSSTA